MKRFLFLSLCLYGYMAVASDAAQLPERSVSLEATELLTREALARYSAPGKITRYTHLVRLLQKPVSELGEPALNLRIPVQSWENGRTKTMIYAQEAWISADMMTVRGRKVRVEQLSETGEVETVVRAKEVQIDRAKMLAVVSGSISADVGTDHLEGRGALIDFNAQYLKVLQHASITTQRAKDADLTNRGMF